MGIIKNSPNAIPWAVLWIFVYITWKHELIGGIILLVFGIFTVLMFDTYEHPLSILTISLPPLLMGIGLIYLSQKHPCKKK